MDPKIWGRNFWTSMIHVAQVYPEQPSSKDQRNYLLYYTIIGEILPCYACRTNYQKHLIKNPIQLQSRQALLNWLHLIYNQTLIENRRSEISYQDFIKKHVQRTSQFSNQRVLWLVILLILVAIVLGYYYFVYRKYSFPLVLRR